MLATARPRSRAVASQSVLATLPAGLGRTLAILGEVARIVLRTAAAVAVLPALAPGFGRALAVIGEVAGAVLPTDMARAGSLFAIFREVARIAGMSLFGHHSFSFHVR
jgi:hypothetical protein